MKNGFFFIGLYSFFLHLILNFLSPFSWADILGPKDDVGLFSARISQINPAASLIRVYVNFTNAKFLNVNEGLTFWTPQNKQSSCQGHILGKTNNYFLVKVIDYSVCESVMRFSQGALLFFYSKDLKVNMGMAKDLVEILVKKRIAIESKLNDEKKELDRYIEKVESINSRYLTLKQKLEYEWQNELENLQVDKLKSLRSYKSLEVRLGEIDHKLEQYRIQDQNLEKDRWSLDSRLYYRK